MIRCQFCGCSELEPCIDLETGWRCNVLADGICSACVSDLIDDLEPSAIEFTTDVKVREDLL